MKCSKNTADLNVNMQQKTCHLYVNRIGQGSLGRVFPRLEAHTCKGSIDSMSEFHILISRENKGPKYKQFPVFITTALVLYLLHCCLLMPSAFGGTLQGNCVGAPCPEYMFIKLCLLHCKKSPKLM